MARTLEYYFEKRGFEVTNVATVASAKVAFAARDSWALIISDFNLPDGDGWELYCWLREQGCSAPPFLLISGALNALAYAAKVPFLAKPFSIGQLESRITDLLSAPPPTPCDTPAR